MDPCPYRREHEWEWELARQGWLCRNCYAFTDKRTDMPLIRPQPPQTDESSIPTPSNPFPAIKA